MWDSSGRVKHSLVLKWGIRFCIAATLLFLLGRLFQLQVLKHGTYVILADSNRLREISIPAPRGLVFDRNGTLLARNRPSYQLTIVPGELPDDNVDTDEIDEEYEAILDILTAMDIGSDRDAVVRIQTTFFRHLQAHDYLKALRRVNAPVSFLQAPVPDLSLEAAVQDTVQLPDLEQPTSLEGLAALIQALVRQRQHGNASAPIPILGYVNRDEVFAVAEQGFRLPGIRVLETATREYVYGEMVSHILGFMGPIPVKFEEEYRNAGYSLEEAIGLSGIEASYQDNLRGNPGLRTIEVDIFGQERRTVGDIQEAIPGQDILLTLDVNLQQIMFNALWDMMSLKNADSAVAIAMDPRNGQVLGMVSLPSFDNNIFSGGLGEGYARIAQDERHPLINYAIGGLYPPGSTFKIVTALAGLEENVISPRTIIVDNGPIYLPNRFAPDDPAQAQEFVSWNHARGFNHGSLTLRKAIAVSNDIYFYQVGGGYPGSFIGLEHSQLVDWARELGYGNESGIDLPGEVYFFVPDDQWKRQYRASNWVTGDSYNMAIGQGYMLATPLQVLQSVMPIANGGTLYRPQLALRIVDSNSGSIVQDFRPDAVRTLDASSASILEIRQGMWEAVNASYGTATSGTLLGVTVAGKTGTAEYCEYDADIQDCVRDEEGNLPTHASYIAFAPFRDPKIAVLVFVYGGGEGSDSAVPVATEILNAYFALAEPAGQIP